MGLKGYFYPVEWLCLNIKDLETGKLIENEHCSGLIGDHGFDRVDVFVIVKKGVKFNKELGFRCVCGEWVRHGDKNHEVLAVVYDE